MLTYMAKYLKQHEGISVSHNFVSVLWRENGIQPHRQGTFKLSKDPNFAVKVVDIVALYLDPPAGAVVLSMDEKTQVQALDRTQPLLPMDFGKTEKRTHDYVRHGTTNLFAALNTQTGEVVGRCFSRRRTVEFIAFLDQVIKQYPGQEVHVIVDNLSTHAGNEINAWLDKHPRVTFHYTPTGQFMEEPDRNLVRDYHPTSDPPRHLSVRSAAHPAHRQLHHPLERTGGTVYLDRNRR
jgi:hypothetical protein